MHVLSTLKARGSTPSPSTKKKKEEEERKQTDEIKTLNLYNTNYIFTYNLDQKNKEVSVEFCHCKQCC
jgi:hypothetical protein